ncbi:hypothetical protein Psi02_44680 [Planotetraspora silvatica]|uniref:Uncharacterized protein n=1 Tax=Planotetraspora silvatica TaxID=234614 RepID=A0A8J3UTF9_9ACTN|nr:hypothetical protein [Planotetraspora silvatica]GII48044.1 hypothetical protein Psi02_44680 [Planotetraspora silvatica]
MSHLLLLSAIVADGIDRASVERIAAEDPFVLAGWRNTPSARSWLTESTGLIAGHA